MKSDERRRGKQAGTTLSDAKIEKCTDAAQKKIAGWIIPQSKDQTTKHRMRKMDVMSSESKLTSGREKERKEDRCFCS